MDSAARRLLGRFFHMPLKNFLFRSPDLAYSRHNSGRRSFVLHSRIIGAIIAAALLIPAPAYARRHDDWHHDHHHHDRDHDGNAVAGAALAIGLIGIAAAVSAKKKREVDERRDTYRYGYGDSYGRDAFSPARDVNCYRSERRCFVRGQFSYEWTDSQFGYDPHRRGY
ncbi:hypothetical protein [Novosphingobium sp. BL-52-GroH]|uniref:hypothetical protein n=1 Tax=Novosphingobium sp. BL-52-GroH TaxID=3349877 RepID=UPI00384DA858